MKKNLLLGFLILFVLSTTAFASLSDPKKESEKPAITNPKENKLSDEELSRMNRRVEGKYNLDKSVLSNIEKNDLKKNLNATNKDSRRDGGYIWVGGGGLLLLIILIIILL